MICTCRKTCNVYSGMRRCAASGVLWRRCGGPGIQERGRPVDKVYEYQRGEDHNLGAIMKLTDILDGIDAKIDRKKADVEISAITNDSRYVKNGGMFVAVHGCSVDGSKFIDQAIDLGANAIVSENDFSAPGSICKILVKNSRNAVPILADNFYSHPSQALKTIGITEIGRASCRERV